MSKGPGKAAVKIEGFSVKAMSAKDCENFAFGKSGNNESVPAPIINIPGSYLVGDIVTGNATSLNTSASECD